MGDRARADIGDDLHVAVRVGREARFGGDAVVVPDPDRAPAHPRRIVIIGEGEMVAGVQPAMVGVAERVEFADVDHDGSLPKPPPWWGRLGGVAVDAWLYARVHPSPTLPIEGRGFLLRLRGELEGFAGEEAEGGACFGDRGLGGFGAEGELFGADEG